jgi:anthranilate phosphoribosyltransferase
MKYAGPTRREIGVRTAFNILGPLTNPAHAKHQLLGVARPEIAPLMAAVLERMGSEHALVVHGHGGCDELTLDGPNEIYELDNGETREYTVSAQELGLTTALPMAIRGGTPEQNAAILTSVLMGEKGPLRDVVLLNAAAALVAADIANDLPDGVRLAAEAIDSGAATARLNAFVELSASFA